VVCPGIDWVCEPMVAPLQPPSLAALIAGVNSPADLAASARLRLLETRGILRVCQGDGGAGLPGSPARGADRARGSKSVEPY
jgi:hypothetical protein